MPGIHPVLYPFVDGEHLEDSEISSRASHSYQDGSPGAFQRVRDGVCFPEGGFQGVGAFQGLLDGSPLAVPACTPRGPSRRGKMAPVEWFFREERPRPVREKRASLYEYTVSIL